MKLLKIHHVAIICSDYAKSKRFYTEILGLPIISEVHRAKRGSCKLDLALPGGVQIELFSFRNSPKRISHPEACGLRHLAFEVMDIDQEVAALMSQGVPVEEVRLDALSRKRFTFFSDPDGLPLELYERG